MELGAQLEKNRQISVYVFETGIEKIYKWTE